jgi:CMP-N,N'-diacetyllegionaminic acid synthase
LMRSSPNIESNDLLIIVPARGGSKGLPGKNSKYLGDIPLLGWTAEAVKQADIPYAKCILSTDDSEIAEIGKKVGLEVPFLRPKKLASDEATMESVVLHAMDWLSSQQGIDIKSVMVLQPTSPFRNPESLSKAVTMLADPDIDGVLGVKHVYRTLATLFYSKENMDITPINANDDKFSRRQETSTMFTTSGSLYLTRSQVLRETNSLFPKRCKGLVCNKIESIDIDDPEDWAISQAVVKAGLTWRK